MHQEKQYACLLRNRTQLYNEYTDLIILEIAIFDECSVERLLIYHVYIMCIMCISDSIQCNFYHISKVL